MKNKPFTKDRRRQPRFKMSATVIAVARPHGVHGGKVIEVSRNGLSFQYRQIADHRLTAQEMDIIWSDFTAAHHLKKLPVRKVSDRAVEATRKSNQPSLRHARVVFTNLSPAQMDGLTQLIKSCGVGAW